MIPRGLTFALFVLFLGSIQAEAQRAHDGQLWAQVVVTPRLSPEWLLHLEGQPRWSEDAEALNQIIVRTAVGRQLMHRLTMWGGYAWIPRTLGPGTGYEHRAWQQLSATFPTVKDWTPSMRLRLEQRFLDSWADNSHRLRLMGRAVRRIGAERRWSIVGWNELMVTLDRTANGPWQGVDQNRVFGGVARQLTRAATLEGGYLWQTSAPPNDARTHSHVAFLWLNMVM